MKTTTSPLDESQRKAFLAGREKREVMSYLKWFRPLVHRAEGEGKKAAKLEQRVRDYRDNAEGLQDTVAQHKDIFMRRCLYGLVLAFYITGEWVVACMVASGIIPGLSDFQACAFYVSGFLVLSLLVKVLSNRSEAETDRKLASLELGQEAEQRWLLAQKWIWVGAKVLVLAAIVLSYVKVYEQRVQIEEKKLHMARFYAETEANANQPLFGEEPAGNQVDAPKANSVDFAAKARKLAEGSLVMMGFLAVMHALVLFFPVAGISANASLHGFEPTRIAAKAEKIRDREEALLRRISYALKDAPEGIVREALIEAVQPVAKRIDALVKRDSGEDTDATGAVPQPPPTRPPDSGEGRAVAHVPAPAAESPSTKSESELYEQLFGVRA